jgi:hypothetical protein
MHGFLKISQVAFYVENEQLATRQITIKTPAFETADVTIKGNGVQNFSHKVNTDIHEDYFPNSPREIFKHPPRKNPQRRNTHVFQSLRRGVRVSGILQCPQQTTTK